MFNNYVHFRRSVDVDWLIAVDPAHLHYLMSLANQILLYRTKVHCQNLIASLSFDLAGQNFAC